MMQNFEGKEDLRVRRTRKMLQDAMIELTIKKGFSDVTVKEICEHAMVNRTTFYRHYLDKYDLLDHYMEDVYRMLDKTHGEPGHQSRQKNVAGLVHQLEHMRTHADFFRAMLGPKGYPPFAERIRFYIEKRIGHSLSANAYISDPQKPPMEMLLRAFSNASLGAILWWLEKDMPVSPEKMANWAFQISEAYMNYVLDGK